MVATLSTGDKIHFKDSVTLTLLRVDGDLISFGLEPSEPHTLDEGALVDTNAGFPINSSEPE